MFKLSLLAIASLISFTSIHANSVRDKKSDSDTTIGVELSSQLRFQGKKVSDYTLIIYCDSLAPETLYVEKAKVIYLDLQYNHNYTLRYLKDGYRERVLLVNTNVDAKTALRDMDFDYQIELVPQNAPANTLGDLPVAIVRYDKAEKKFDATLSDDDMVQIVLKGKKPEKPPNMPAFEERGITADQAKAMVVYIKSIR